MLARKLSFTALSAVPDKINKDGFSGLSLHFNPQESADNWSNGQCEVEGLVHGRG